MTLSVTVALIFTPSLCATLLRPRVAEAHERERGFFGWFNRGYQKLNQGYAHGLDHVTHRWGRSLLLYVAIVVVMAVLLGSDRPGLAVAAHLRRALAADRANAAGGAASGDAGRDPRLSRLFHPVGR